MVEDRASIRPESTDLTVLLSQASKRTKSLGGDFAVMSGQLENLRARLTQGRLHLAVLGQFKRGKSTLLNALLGEPVLPTAVVPLTAVPTFIRPGETLGVRVHFQDSREPQEASFRTLQDLRGCLVGFVTESGNPENRLGVSHVEVFHPSPLLGKGVVLIDTPGIGSTLRHNTEATLNFLPRCDAALFLISADPPITEVEVDFLKQVRSKVARLFFILNKADYLNSEERQAVLDFLRKVLAEQAGIPADVPIFCLSARQGLEARRHGDGGSWAGSGLAAVERHLVEFLANEKAAALREAVGRQAADALNEGLMQLRLAIRSLQMPLDDLKQRLDLFAAKIAEAQRQQVAADDLLAGDRRRMHDFLEEHAEHLRAESREYLSGIVKEAMAGNTRADETEVRDALAEAIPGYFEHQTGLTTEMFRGRMAETFRPHQQRADELIESVRRAAAELFDVPYCAPESADAFEMAEQPYWVTHKWASTLSPLPIGLIDRLLPVSVRQRRIRRRLLDEVEGLVIHNVENLRWAIYQSIDRTFIKFGSTLDRRLTDIIAATEGAIRATMERRLNQGETVLMEVARLEKAAADLEALQSSLGG